MATFRKIPPRVEAVQWPTEHHNVTPLGGTTPHFCGHVSGEHGVMEHTNQWVCPGDWIVTDGGVVSKMTDAEFKTAFEAELE